MIWKLFLSSTLLIVMFVPPEIFCLIFFSIFQWFLNELCLETYQKTLNIWIWISYGCQEGAFTFQVQGGQYQSQLFWQTIPNSVFYSVFDIFWSKVNERRTSLGWMRKLVFFFQLRLLNPILAQAFAATLFSWRINQNTIFYLRLYHLKN